MIEIFKTNVTKRLEAKRLLNLLLEILPNAFINFDLEDCDRILRIENVEQNFDIQQIIALVEKMGFYCEVWND